MDIFYSLDGKQPLVLDQVSSQKYRGELLAGSSLYVGTNSELSLVLQEFEGTGFTIRYNILRFLKKIGLIMREKKAGIRFQAAIKNELRYVTGKEKYLLKEGRYMIAPNAQEPLRITPIKNRDSHYFLTSCSPEFIAGLGIASEKLLHTTKPRSLTPEMSGIIQDMLKAPYDQGLLRYFYENKVRELLFLVLLQNEVVLPGQLSAKELDAILAADYILQSNFQHKLSMEELVKKVQLNPFKLKKGFKQLFGMGVFERLLHYKMERAKKLLIHTNKSEKDIALLAGYRHLTSFITEFTKRFGVSPRVYRKMNK